jgi:hypothetical protein
VILELRQRNSRQDRQARQGRTRRNFVFHFFSGLGALGELGASFPAPIADGTSISFLRVFEKFIPLR